MRKSEIVLVLSILILIVSCDGINYYDYLQVVMQWQPATCTDLNKPPCYQDPSNVFSIHGTWPSLYSGYIPRCSGTPFDVYQVNQLEPRLSQDWPNVATGDNLWLWEHEWNKHGTCTEYYHIFNQQNYFTFTMNAYFQSSLLIVLSNNQITPNGQTYTTDQIYAAIRARTGKTPAVRCNYNWSTGFEQLHEITICYTWDATDFEDCPPNANSCSTSFFWSS